MIVINALAARRPARFDESLFPFESRYLEIGGHQVHYIDEGAGPTLLFLHGNPTWSFLYRHIISALRERFRCIAPDYPGFGRSTAAAGYGYTPAEQADVVEKFLLQLDLRDVTVMGQDWGGPIGLGVATRHPYRFKALIVGNTWAWPLNGDAHFERFSGLMGGAVGRVIIPTFNAFVNLLIPAGVKRHKVSPAVMAAYRYPFPTRATRWPTYVFPREIIHSHDYLAEVEAGLSHLEHLPALILWGNQDIAFRDVERRRFEGLFPNHRTVILEGAGHYIQEDAPDEIVEAIKGWWSEMVEIL